MKNTCNICGTDITHMRPDAKICRSKICLRTRKRRRDRRAREEAREGRVCLVCKTTLTKVQKKYCGDACYKEAKSLREFAKRKKHVKATHKSPKPKNLFVVRPDDFSHKKYLAKMKAARKQNGWKCRECGKPLSGNDRFWCLKHKKEDVGTFLNSDGGTGGRSSAVGVWG